MSSGPYKLIYEVLLIDDGSKEENLDPLYDFADRWEGLAEYDISFFLNVIRIEFQDFLKLYVVDALRKVL